MRGRCTAASYGVLASLCSGRAGEDCISERLLLTLLIVSRNAGSGMELKMANLPYVTATGNITKALDGIISAATPERVSQDFVKTILKISGGSGNQMTSFLKKIGFANSDGTPSKIYKKFRNTATRGFAAAQSLKEGYAALYVRNEYMHKLSEADLKGLVIEETGAGDDSAVPTLVVSSIKALKKYADFSDQVTTEVKIDNIDDEGKTHMSARDNLSDDSDFQAVGMNLGYTINLNLPPTSDIAVFNAIFKSLKENLLKNDG